MNFTLKLFLIILLICSKVTYSQFGFEFDDSIMVIRGSDTLKNAWGGGLNYAQFSDFDYDYDGDLDLFVFDRSKNNIRVFTQENNGEIYYKLAYNSKNKFPDNIRYRATMIDYDNDGRKDLFTQGIGGLKVYKNIGDASIGLEWELTKELLFSQYPSGYSNLIVNSSDIPAIVDVDGDSDIDILTFHQGGTNLEYHQNQSMELYGIPDSLIFVLKNQCWGKFSEDINTNSITLNETNYPCQGGEIANPENNEKTTRHAGSTVLALDYNNSGVLDLIIGDISFTNLNLLINGGTTVNSDSPMISIDNSFPSNTNPVNIQLFPAAYLLDVDFDLVKDLIVCPNAKNISFNESSVFFYKNIGTNEDPSFIFNSNNLLQKNMIEHGTGSVPIFTDINEDGKKDMIISNFYRYKPILEKESTLAYYQNVGTLSNPVFSYVDYDYLNLSSKNYGLRSVPTFGDIDGDNDNDIIIGTEIGKLIYYENMSSGNGSVYSNEIFDYQDYSGTPINVLAYAYPQLFDLNNDGLLDLIIGNKNGKIFYYKNIGTLTEPSFQLFNSMLGNIDVSSNIPDGYASPHFFRLNNETHLFIGGIDGKLRYYNNIDGNLDQGQDFTLISDNYLNINVEGYSSFVTNDINQDGNLDLFVGQDLGGVFHFEANPNNNASMIEVKQEDQIKIFPNPTNKTLTIIFKEIEGKEYIIENINGDRIEKSKILGKKHKINIDKLSRGIYFIKIKLETGIVFNKKIVKY